MVSDLPLSTPVSVYQSHDDAPAETPLQFKILESRYRIWSSPDSPTRHHIECRSSMNRPFRLARSFSIPSFPIPSMNGKVRPAPSSDRDEADVGLPDCTQFQELLFAAKLVFIAGIAEAKSKGRGEECISQNLRILRGRNDRQVILFFANSQRREKKRYVSIPGK